MSLNKIKQVKDGRFFKTADLIIYSAVILAVAALFVFFVLLPDRSTLSASGAVAEISSGGIAVYAYDFGRGEGGVTAQEDRLKVRQDGQKTEVTVFFGEAKTDYNIIIFDAADGGSVSCTEANCSLRHDCTYMKIAGTAGSIVCIPHALKVYIRSDIAPPVSGGHLSGAACYSKST